MFVIMQNTARNLHSLLWKVSLISLIPWGISDKTLTFKKELEQISISKGTNLLSLVNLTIKKRLRAICQRAAHPCFPLCFTTPPLIHVHVGATVYFYSIPWNIIPMHPENPLEHKAQVRQFCSAFRQTQTLLAFR